MIRSRPLETQMLNSGEPRHFAGRGFGSIPKIDRSGLVPTAEALHRRQKAYAPRYRTRGLSQILNVLRSRQ